MKKRPALLHLIPLSLSAFVLLPLIFLAGGSLTGAMELQQRLGPVLGGQPGFAGWRLLPAYPTLAAWVELLLDSPRFFVHFWNSAGLAGGVLAGQAVVATTGAWWFARTRSRLGQALFTVYIILMLMPFQVTSVPTFLVLDRTGLLDTRWAVMLPAVFSTFPVFIIHRFFRAIPSSFPEAARIDGANRLEVFLYVGAPLGKAGIASALVLGFIDCWNMIEQPLTFLRDKSLWPLSLYLPAITADAAGPALAASVVILVPSALIFLFGQEYLEQGISGAGLKE